MKKAKSSLQNQRGQSLVEYLILVALVSVGAMAVLRVVGQSVQVKFAKVAESLGADVDQKIGSAKITTNSWKKKDISDFMSGSRKSNSSQTESNRDSEE